MKRLFIAFTLACVFSATALAGEMPADGRSATGDMPGVGGSLTGEMPGVGGATTGQTSVAPVVGEMPGGGSATASETESSLVTIVLLTLINFIGR